MGICVETSIFIVFSEMRIVNCFVFWIYPYTQKQKTKRLPKRLVFKKALDVYHGFRTKKNNARYLPWFSSMRFSVANALNKDIPIAQTPKHNSRFETVVPNGFWV